MRCKESIISMLDYSPIGMLVKVTFTISNSFNGPLYLYYELTNYYQNHRRYILSRSLGQLQGQVIN